MQIVFWFKFDFHLAWFVFNLSVSRRPTRAPVPGFANTDFFYFSSFLSFPEQSNNLSCWRFLVGACFACKVHIMPMSMFLAMARAVRRWLALLAVPVPSLARTGTAAAMLATNGTVLLGPAHQNSLNQRAHFHLYCAPFPSIILIIIAIWRPFGRARSRIHLPPHPHWNYPHSKPHNHRCELASSCFIF